MTEKRLVKRYEICTEVKNTDCCVSSDDIKIRDPLS